MHTQNVNVKTAAPESSERWGADPEKRLARVIAEQKSYLHELCGLWNLQLEQSDEGEELCRILSAMAKNVLNNGVTCWHRSYPLIAFSVAQPWLQAKAHALRLYGITGRTAWEYAHKELKDGITFGQDMRQKDMC